MNTTRFRGSARHGTYSGHQYSANKHVVIGLQSIFGIGRTARWRSARAPASQPTTKVKDLTDAEVEALRTQMAKLR